MDDKGIIIDNYLNKYYYVVIGEIKLSGDKINDDSFIIKSYLNEDDTYKSSFIKEINLIFGDGEDEESNVNKITLDWYLNKIRGVSVDANNKIDYMKNYFKDNVIMKLGSRNWETYDKDGRPFLLKYALDDLDKLNVSWINTKVVRHFYDQWFEEEVIKTSEKLMNFN